MIDFNYTAPELLPFRIQEVLDAPSEPHRIGNVVYMPEVGGECRNEWAEFGKFRCSECGLQVNAISTNTTQPMPIRYCPNCGKAVERNG